MLTWDPAVAALTVAVFALIGLAREGLRAIYAAGMRAGWSAAMSHYYATGPEPAPTTEETTGHE